jgi:hypothetical protein
MFHWVGSRSSMQAAVSRPDSGTHVLNLPLVFLAQYDEIQVTKIPALTPLSRPKILELLFSNGMPCLTPTLTFQVDTRTKYIYPNPISSSLTNMPSVTSLALVLSHDHVSHLGVIHSSSGILVQDMSARLPPGFGKNRAKMSTTYPSINGQDGARDPSRFLTAQEHDGWSLLRSACDHR